MKAIPLLSLAAAGAALCLGGFFIVREALSDHKSLSRFGEEPKPADAVAEKPSVKEIVARIEDRCRRGIWRPTDEWNANLDALSSVEIAEIFRSAHGAIFSPRQNFLQVALISQWARLNPASAFHYARKLPATRNRSELLTEVLLHWAISDPSRAAHAIQTLPEPLLQIDLISKVSMRLADLELEQAIRWQNALPEGAGKRAAVEQIAQVVVAGASSDPGHVCAWVAGIPAGPARDQLLSEAGNQLAKTEPAAAFEMVIGLPSDDPARNDLLGRIGKAWALRDPSAAMRRAIEMSADEAQAAFMQGALAGLIEKSPVEAASYVAALPSGELQNSALGLVVSQWAARQPQAAADWVSNFGPGEPRDNALNAVVSQWAPADPGHTAQWLSTMPANEARDNAIHSYTQYVASRAPELAPALILAISNQPLRVSAIETLARGWSTINPEAAKRWLLSAQIPPELRSRLLDEIDKSGAAP